MTKYFISTIAPNGFSIKNDKHMLKLSICMELDLASLAETDPETMESDNHTYKARFAEFYKSFDNVYNVFNVDNLELTVENRIYKRNEITEITEIGSEQISVSHLNELRSKLWNNIFAQKTQWTDSGLKPSDRNKEIGSLSRIKKATRFRAAYASITDDLSYIKDGTAGTLDEYYISTARATKAYRGPAKKQAQNYIAGLYLENMKNVQMSEDQSNTMAEVSITNHVLDYEILLKNYLKANIDPEEFISTFNIINKNIILKKLLGFIIDVEVEMSNTKERLFAAIAKVNDPGWFNLASDINLWNVPSTSGARYAYLLDSKDGFFEKTVLLAKKNGMSLTRVLTFDSVSQEEKMKAWTKSNPDQSPKSYAKKADSFTRGLIYIHDQLADLIAPTDYPRDQNNIIIDNSYLDDRIFIHGYRAAVMDVKNGKLASLTATNAMVYTSDESKPQLKCPKIEGCVHFDAIAHKMNDDGSISATSTDTMFEWSGQPLTLKSAFSRSSKVSKAQKDLDAANNPDTDGVQKSQFNTEQHLYVDSFPFKESPHKKEANVKLLYGLPDVREEDIVKLRFGNNYSFIVSQEYKNGWGLPLFADSSSQQASISDFLYQDISKNLVSETRQFYPLENKKPVLFYPRKEIKDDDISGVQIPLNDKESLTHLIVRSNTGHSINTIIAERHVLPDRISLEHAFWRDLLSKHSMDNDQQLQWKRQYNCPFLTREDYESFLNEKDDNGNLLHKSCPETCGSYCGGTQMKKYYPDTPVRPKYLTDPVVAGFYIRLYWDQDCKNLFMNFPDPIHFNGARGINPISYLIKAQGSSNETTVVTYPHDNTLEIPIKKGMNLYAEIQNELTTEGSDEISKVWWNQNDDFRGVIPADYDAVRNVKDLRNLPIVVTLTHAVREPLVTPTIYSFYSAQENDLFIAHIQPWLLRPENKNYKIDSNIISVRSPKDLQPCGPGGTFARFILTAYFERLDATGRGKDFLPDVLPTGGLELWMRKEDFIDDPKQIVLAPSKGAVRLAHSPEQPVRTFNDPLNVFSLDYKIEFSNTVLQQIKDRVYITELKREQDIYRDILTEMLLGYDFKTTKFEEREYFLKDISKFSGFFEQGKDPEEFTLPKIREVMAGGTNSLRFKLMVLNNQPPAPPEVAFAVTTIRESRCYPKNKWTVSSQKGNTVTFYLKRGRLSSGKNERVGIIVNSPGRYQSIFKSQDLISKAGRDIISDQFSPSSIYLRREDIITPAENEYDAGFDAWLGIWHFLPKFDVEKQLWKFEVELDITAPGGKQLHNPFINFSLVHYQPFSLDYSKKTPFPVAADLDRDCRISKVVPAIWCYLLPEREVSVFFHKPAFLFGRKGNASLTVSFNHESLHYFNNGKVYIVRSNFVLTVEGSHDKKVWHPLPSTLNNGTQSVSHPLLTEAMIASRADMASIEISFDKHVSFSTDSNAATHAVGLSYFRLRFLEVEWFEEKTWEDMHIDEMKDILENEDMRVRYVELIY